MSLIATIEEEIALAKSLKGDITKSTTGHVYSLSITGNELTPDTPIFPYLIKFSPKKNWCPEKVIPWLKKHLKLNKFIWKERKNEDFPSEISQLKGIKYLEVHLCPLPSFPPAICTMENLVELELTSTHLTSIPTEISRLKRLKKINLLANQIKSIPDAIGELQELEELNLTRNVLEELPRCIEKLSKLRVLDASNNHIKAFPPGICNLEQLMELDLSDNEIPSIPAEIARLQNLVKIRLSGNALTSLPTEIGGLKQLKEVSFSKNKIDNIPEVFCDLPELLEFNLYKNPLKNIPKGLLDFPKLKRLSLESIIFDVLKRQGDEPLTFEGTAYDILSINEISWLKQQSRIATILLSITNKKLKDIPPIIFEFGDIEIPLRLRLSENAITSIPAEIGKLKNLVHISLEKNAIISIPIEICGLKRLRVMNFYKNKIESIPDGIGELQELRRIDFYDNPIKQAPNRLLDLPLLKELGLGSIRFKALKKSGEEPQSFEGKAYELWEEGLNSWLKQQSRIASLALDFRGKRMKEISPILYELECIQTMNLLDNYIEKLPEEIGNLKKLQVLNLSRNKIQVLPDRIGNLENLRELQVSYNKISVLPFSIGNLKKLEVFIADYNPIASIPESMYQLSNLKRVSLQKTLINNLPEIYRQIKEIKTLSLKGITNLPDWFFEWLENSAIESLNSDSRRIKRDEQGKIIGLKLSYIQLNIPNTISVLTDLKRLEIEGMKLNKVPVGIFELRNLEVLKLSNQKIAKIPANIKKLTKLKELRLAQLQLEELPDIFEHLPELMILDVGHNNLHRLPNSIRFLKKLKYLNISGTNIVKLPDWMATLPSLKNLRLTEELIKVFPQIYQHVKGAGKLFWRGVDLNTLPDWFFDWFERSGYERTMNYEFEDTAPSISKNKGGKISSINFGDAKLTRLPKSIVKLTELDHLRLRNAELADYSPIYELHGLKTLDCFNMPGISEEILLHFPNLVRAYLGAFNGPFSPKLVHHIINSRLIKVEFKTQGYDKSEIILKRDEKGNVLSLKIVNLHLDIFPDLKKEIQQGNLRFLEELKVSGNLFNSIPDIFTGLDRLTVLDLSNNPISALPPSLGSIQSLKKLYLNGTFIDHLPDFMLTLPNLEPLFIDPPKTGITRAFIDSLKAKKIKMTKGMRWDKNENITHLEIKKINTPGPVLEHILDSFPSLKYLVVKTNDFQNLSVEFGKKLAKSSIQRLELNKASIQLPNEGSKKIFWVKEDQKEDEEKSGDKTSAIQASKTSLPDWIAYLDLEEIFIENLNIRSVPSWLAHMPSLKELFLKYTHIREIPENLLESKSLSTVFIKSKEVISFPKAIVIGMEKSTLQKFEINGLKMSKDKAGKVTAIEINNRSYVQEFDFSLFPNLKSIKMKHYHSPVFPNTLRNLKALTELEMHRCKGLRIPDWFWPWVKECGLQIFTFGINYKNRIRTDDNGILIGLDLSNLELEEVPANLGSLENLETLDLHANNLYKIPTDLQTLIKLKTLDLSDNCLTDIPDFIPKLPQLIRLNLINNCIASIDSTLFKSKSLTHCNLYLNPIESVGPDCWYEVKHSRLTTLYLGESNSNRIATNKNGSIFALDLRGLTLTSFPSFLKEMTGLKRVDLRETGLVGDENATAIIAWIIESQVEDVAFGEHGNVISIEKDTENNLVMLDLSEMNLTRIPDVVRKLRKLRYLVLKGNQITNIPAWISTLKDLKYSDLSRNPITKIDSSLGSLKLLESLVLQGVPFSAIRREFWEKLPASCIKNLVIDRFPENRITRDANGKLVSLDLSRLKIKHIPAWIFTFNDLRELDLSTNLISNFSREEIERIRKNNLNLWIDESLRGRLTEILPFVTFSNALPKISEIITTEHDLKLLSAKIDYLSDINKVEDASAYINEFHARYATTRETIIRKGLEFEFLVEYNAFKTHKNWDSARKLADKWARTYPCSSNPGYYDYTTAWTLGEYERARNQRGHQNAKYAFRIKHSERSHIFTLWNIIPCIMRMRKFTLARRLLALATSLFPRVNVFYLFAIQTCLGEGDFEGALEYCKKYDKALPNAQVPYCERLDVLLYIMYFKKKTTTRDSLTELKEIEAVLQDAKSKQKLRLFHHIAQVRYLLDKGDFNQARDLKNTLEKYLAKRTDGYMEKAMIAKLIDHDLKAAEKFGLMYYYDFSHDNRILDFLGDLYMELGNKDQAIFFYKQIADAGFLPDYYMGKIKQLEGRV